MHVRFQEGTSHCGSGSKGAGLSVGTGGSGCTPSQETRPGLPPSPLMLPLWSRVQDSSLATGFSGQPRRGKVLIVTDCRFCPTSASEPQTVPGPHTERPWDCPQARLHTHMTGLQCSHGDNTSSTRNPPGGQKEVAGSGTTFTPKPQVSMSLQAKCTASATAGFKSNPTGQVPGDGTMGTNVV